MVNLVMMSLGVVLLAFGWVFHRVPEAGFQIRNFPFVLGNDGLTEAGESSYRMQGTFLMVVGYLIIVTSIFY